MSYSKKFKTLTLCATASAILLVDQSAFAHTVLQTKTINEGATVYNKAVIGHGCEGNNSVRANSIVFPDGQDSIITRGGGVIIEGATVEDYLTGYGNNVQMVLSRDIFTKSAEKWDPASIDPVTGLPVNRVGFHSWDGELPYPTLGLVPFRTDAFTINAESCAKTVKLLIPIADICTTGLDKAYDPAEVNLWTPALDGSNYNGDPGEHHYNSPASLTITRVSPLPGTCGAGINVIIKPSAAQINRDLPIPDVWSLAPAP